MQPWPEPFIPCSLPWSFPDAKVGNVPRTHAALRHTQARSVGQLMSMELPLTNKGTRLDVKCFSLHLLVESSEMPLISFLSQVLRKPHSVETSFILCPHGSFPFSFPDFSSPAWKAYSWNTHRVQLTQLGKQEGKTQTSPHHLEGRPIHRWV